jgi:Flp pilus assembly protein TadD
MLGAVATRDMDRGPGPVARSEAGVRERIRLLVELSRPREAVELARRARAQGDASPELDELEGLGLIRRGDPVAALEALQRGLKVAPERPHLHYLWSFAARSQGRLPDARAAIREALRLASEEPVYLRAEAELLSEDKEHAAALVSAHAAVRCGPDRAANHVTLGFVASAAGDKVLARQSYERALALDPEDASAWNNLGCLDLEDGKAQLARERFRESLRLAPEGQRARKNLDQTLAGRTVDDFAHFDDLVRALAEELAEAGQGRLLIALALETDAARPALVAALTRPGKLGLGAALGAVSAGAILGMLSGGGAGRLFGAGVGVLASVGLSRLVSEERRRVRGRLAADRPAFEGLRRDWLDGRTERAARDVAVRRLVERAALVLCEPDPDPAPQSRERS